MDKIEKLARKLPDRDCLRIKNLLIKKNYAGISSLIDAKFKEINNKEEVYVEDYDKIDTKTLLEIKMLADEQLINTDDTEEIEFDYFEYI